VIRGKKREEISALVLDLQRAMSGLDRDLVEVSHAIHQYSELRFEERRSSALLQGYLRRQGFLVTAGLGGMETAFWAERCYDQPGPTIGIFCEFDALEGIGHACGHNIIAAVGVGAATVADRWLMENGKARGKIVVIGSPGEEGGGGKIRLLDAGILSEIDAAVMVHPAGFDAVRRINPGRVGLDIKFRGRAAHAAAAPEEGRNALDAATLLLVAIGLLRQQIRGDSRIHAIVRDGGQAVNVIPEEASLSVYVRSPDGAYLRERLETAVVRCAEAASLATETKMTIGEASPAYLPVVANPALVALAEEVWGALGRSSGTGDSGTVLSGSTDMGNVSYIMPAIHPYLCVTPGAILHTRDFAREAMSENADRAVIDGTVALGTMACALLSFPWLIEAVRDSFGDRSRDSV